MSDHFFIHSIHSFVRVVKLCELHLEGFGIEILPFVLKECVLFQKVIIGNVVVSLDCEIMKIVLRVLRFSVTYVTLYKKPSLTCYL